ncbi:MAG: PAS domain S-box protein [Desulfobacteraceae bacterium]|nr:PAS domain S-box protein [Desulfobacteraceae bacterium]
MKTDKYKELFERSADAILIIEEGKFVDCNTAALKMLGYENKQELLDTHPSQLSPELQPDGRLSYEKADEMMATAFKNGTNRFEWEHKRADGAIVPVEVLLTAVPGENKGTLHVVWRDISDRKQNEKDLLRLKSIIESTSDIISSATPDGKIIFLNDSGQRKLGKSSEKPLETISDFHPGWAYDLIMSQGLAHALDQGLWEAETAVLNAKNQEIAVSQVLMAHKDASGRLEYLSTIIRDISDRKRSEQLLNNIITNMPICVKLVGKDGTLIAINPAGVSIMGAGQENEIVGQCIYDIVADEDREKFIRFNEAVCQGEKGSLIFSINSLDGKRLHVDSIAVPLQYGPDNETVQLGITRDITEQMKNQAERLELKNRLNQAQKMEAVGTLAGGIAHDFNNILSGIFGYTQLAKNHLGNPQKTAHYLDQIIKGANKAADLVQQILTFSRKSTHEKKPLRIYIVVKEALKLLRASIPSTIEIREHFNSRARIMADAVKIHQVVMNLCTNAYHAMRESGGVMTVGLTEIDNLEEHMDGLHGKTFSGPHVRLEVRDTGVGMDQDTINKIFEPYYTTKEAGKGTGLGLAVVHGIIEEHQGYITVHSKPGQGTCFNIFLPITSENEEILSEPPGKKTLLKGGGHILLVDDEKSILESTSDLLQYQGYQVTSFSNGADAYKEFEKNPDRFDVIVSDMTMPGMTGDILSQKILALRPNLPIFLCSGYSENLSERRLMEIGIRKFFQKPVIPHELAFEIQEILSHLKP